MKEELKELSFQMMLNETEKMLIENERNFSIMTGNQASLHSSAENYHRGLIRADKKGYELSLAFNELLLQNRKRHNAFKDGPDAVNIAAENLLYKYGLKYPISWYVEYEDRNGLHFGYHYSNQIDKNHEKYLTQVNHLLQTGKIDQYTSERLILAGEYYANHHKLLSKYYNREVIEESKGISRH